MSRDALAWVLGGLAVLLAGTATYLGLNLHHEREGLAYNGGLYLSNHGTRLPRYDALVGIGCERAPNGRVLIRWEEDEFPGTCARIEPVNLEDLTYSHPVP